MRARRARGGADPEGSPKTEMAPLVGRTRPVMQRIKVVLPAPLGPSKTKSEDRGMDRSTPRKASTRPCLERKETPRLLARMIAWESMGRFGGA